MLAELAPVRARKGAPVQRPAAPQARGQAPLMGVHFLTDHSCYYPPQITTTDILEVNFDKQRIDYDGTYLIAYPEAADSRGRAWGGVRRFQRIPVSGLHIFEGDEWIKVHEGHRDMIVIGEVLNVYRRTR